jgi:Skp family chaperone for outer membrane proteins
VILATSGAAAQEDPPDRVGVFDPESVWRLSNVGRDYNETLSNAANKLQDRIESKQQEIEGLVDKLRQQQASLSEDKVQAMQKDVQTKRIELDRLNTDAKREMNDQLNEIQGRFQRMLIETIQALGKEENFTVILSLEVVGYSAPRADITQDLIAKFNEMHKVPPESASKTSSKSN